MDRYEIGMPGDQDSFLLNRYEVGEATLQRLDEADTEQCVGVLLEVRGLGGPDGTRRITVTMTNIQAAALGYAMAKVASR